MQYPVREGSVKEIASPRGVHNVDLIRGSIPEAGAIPSKRTVYADCRANGARAIFSLELRERFEEIGFISGVDGEFLRGDWVVDEGKKAQQSQRHMIQVGYNRDARRARPGGGYAGGCGVVPIDVQKASRRDPASLEESWRHGEPRVAAPNDGALPGAAVYKDERHLAQRSRYVDEVGVDPSTPKFTTVELGGVVVADDSDIVCAKSPALAGDECGGDLAAGQNLGAEHFDLGTQGGELGELQNGICGVLADPKDVETSGAHKVVVQGIGRAEKIKAR
jgi:hypothetical protein